MKYECLKSFTDKYDSSIHYEKGKIYEFTPERAKECFDKYGVDAIMIGRGSIGQPWIFEEIKHYLYNNSKLERKKFKFYISSKKSLNYNLFIIYRKRIKHFIYLLLEFQ